MSSPHSTSPVPSIGCRRHRRGFPDFFDPTTLSSLTGSGGGGGGFGRTGALRMGRRSRSGFQFKDDAGYIGYISDGADDGGDGGGDGGSFRNISRMPSHDFLQIRRQFIGSDISFVHTGFAIILIVSFCVCFVAFVKRFVYE